MTITDEIARLPEMPKEPSQNFYPDRNELVTTYKGRELEFDHAFSIYGSEYSFALRARLLLLTRAVEAYLNDTDNIYANSVGALDDLRAVLAAVKL